MNIGRGYRLFILFALICVLPVALYGQRVSDVKLRYSGTTITRANLENVGTLEVDFYRHVLEAELGLGQAFVGMTYQYATKEKNTGKLGNSYGKAEDGAMLTAGYNFIFSNRFRLEAFGRAGIWGKTNYAQALYATETDVRLNLVMFDPDGMALINRRPLFPSGHLGVNVNKFGRVQGVSGAGLWWNNLGFYLTAFHAFNGVNEALNPGEDADKAFANLKNSGVTFGVTYEYHEFLIWLKHNYALRNGGNDLTLSLQYQRFFQKRRR